MKTEKLEFRGGNYMSLLPFAVFIITTIALSFANFQDISMHELTALVKKDMVPALGVTEPGAIAYCVSKARSCAKGGLVHLNVAMNSGHIDRKHGINGKTPEDTMRNMGLIASPGMTGTEKTIVEIFEDKLK